MTPGATLVCLCLHLSLSLCKLADSLSKVHLLYRHICCLNALDLFLLTWETTTVWMVLISAAFDAAHFSLSEELSLDLFHAEGHKHINTSPVVLWEPRDIYKNEHQTVILEAEWTSFILSNATVLPKLQHSSDVPDPVLPTISHSDVSLIDGQALIWEWWELHLGRMRGLGLIDFRARLDNSWLLSSALTFKGREFQHWVKEWFRAFVRTRHIDLNETVPKIKMDCIKSNEIVTGLSNYYFSSVCHD